MDWSVPLFLRERWQISVLILPIYRIIIWVLTWVWINPVTDTQLVAVLTYLCTLCFFLRASDWSSNVQCRKCRTLPYTRNCPVTSAPWVWSIQCIYYQRNCKKVRLIQCSYLAYLINRRKADGIVSSMWLQASIWPLQWRHKSHIPPRGI